MKIKKNIFALALSATSFFTGAVEPGTYYYTPSPFCKVEDKGVYKENPFFTISEKNGNTLNIIINEKLFHESNKKAREYFTSIPESSPFEIEKDTSQAIFDTRYKVTLNKSELPAEEAAKLLIPMYENNDEESNALMAIVEIVKDFDAPVSINTQMEFVTSPANSQLFLIGLYTKVTTVEENKKVFEINHYYKLQDKLPGNTHMRGINAAYGACLKSA